MRPFHRLKRHRHSIRLKGYDYSRAGAYFVTIVTQDRIHRFGHIRHGVVKLNAVGAMVHSTLERLDEWYPGVYVDAFQVMPDHVHVIIVLAPPIPIAASEPVGAGLRACPRHASPPSPPPCRFAHPRDPNIAHPRDPNIAHPRDPNIARPHASDVARRSMCETDRREKSNGSAPPGSGGQARRPAPTGSRVDLGAFALGDIVQRFKSWTTSRYRHAVTPPDCEPYSRRLWQRNYYERIIRDEDALNRIRAYIHNNPRKWGIPRRAPVDAGLISQCRK